MAPKTMILNVTHSRINVKNEHNNPQRNFKLIFLHDTHKLGYNRSVSAAQSDTIGILQPDTAHWAYKYISELLDSIERRASFARTTIDSLLLREGLIIARKRRSYIM